MSDAMTDMRNNKKLRDRIEELERELHSVRADRDSWAEQADERVKDAVGFIQERDALLANNERLREAIIPIYDSHVLLPVKMSQRLHEALAATPEQSLARIRNQVREECKQACLNEWGDDLGKFVAGRCAETIEEMKEPE